MSRYKDIISGEVDAIEFTSELNGSGRHGFLNYLVEESIKRGNVVTYNEDHWVIARNIQTLDNSLYDLMDKDGVVGEFTNFNRGFDLDMPKDLTELNDERVAVIYAHRYVYRKSVDLTLKHMSVGGWSFLLHDAFQPLDSATEMYVRKYPEALSNHDSIEFYRNMHSTQREPILDSYRAVNNYYSLCIDILNDIDEETMEYRGTLDSHNLFNSKLVELLLRLGRTKGAAAVMKYLRKGFDYTLTAANTLLTYLGIQREVEKIEKEKKEEKERKEKEKKEKEEREAKERREKTLREARENYERERVGWEKEFEDSDKSITMVERNLDRIGTMA